MLALLLLENLSPLQHTFLVAFNLLLVKKFNTQNIVSNDSTDQLVLIINTSLLIDQSIADYSFAKANLNDSLPMTNIISKSQDSFYTITFIA